MNTSSCQLLYRLRWGGQGNGSCTPLDPCCMPVQLCRQACSYQCCLVKLQEEFQLYISSRCIAVPPFRVQFLPQDKVVEFARMSPVDLLAATEKVRWGHMLAPRLVSNCLSCSLQAAAALGNGVNVAATPQLTSLLLVCSI